MKKSPNTNSAPENQIRPVRPGLAKIATLDQKLAQAGSEQIDTTAISTEARVFAVEALAVACRYDETDPEAVLAIVEHLDDPEAVFVMVDHLDDPVE